MQVDCRAARPSGRVLVEHGDNAVIARVDQPLQVDGPFEILGPSAHELDETVAPSVDGPEAGCVWSRYPFGIGCEGPGVVGRAWIAPSQASLKRLESPTHDLHVLLRHRPRSISRRGRRSRRFWRAHWGGEPGIRSLRIP